MEIKKDRAGGDHPVTAGKKADRLVRRIDGLLRFMRKDGIEEVVVSGMVIRAEDDLIVVIVGGVEKLCFKPTDVAQVIRDEIKKRIDNGEQDI